MKSPSPQKDTAANKVMNLKKCSNMGEMFLGCDALHCNRQVKGHLGPLPQLAVHVNAPAMLLDDALHNRQAQAGAGGLGAEEGLKDMREIGG